MNRFFVSPSDIKNNQITIRDGESYHLRKVLRLTPGDRIQVADGQGNEYLAEIIRVGEQTDCRIIEKVFAVPEPQVNVILWQGIPKGDKMELIIQKCTELGVVRIKPVYTKRTVVKLDPKKQRIREERWQRIALEAAKQCGRAIVPKVDSIFSFQDAISVPKGEGLYLLCAETEKVKGLKQVLEANMDAREVHILVGPEGGFAEEEIRVAKNNGWYPVSLGQRILRTETAGIAGLTMILYQFGQLGG